MQKMADLLFFPFRKAPPSKLKVSVLAQGKGTVVPKAKLPLTPKRFIRTYALWGDLLITFILSDFFFNHSLFKEDLNLIIRKFGQIILN